MVLTGCATNYHRLEISDTVKTDTTRHRDTVLLKVRIKGDTVRKTDTLTIYQRLESLNLDTLKAEGIHSRSQAGIINGRLFLDLFEYPIKKDTFFYRDTIKIVKEIKRTRKESFTRVKTLSFYKDHYFWLFLLMLFLYAIKLRK